jgi:ATP-dependent helicase HepA
MPTEPRFRIGERVSLTADRPTTGAVVEVIPRPEGGWTYKVFFGLNDERLVNEHGLSPAAGQDELHVLDREGFLIALLLAKLESPLSDLLYSYQASRTQYEPYQFKPVLKYLDAPAPGILIADEVGLGKTIEAAILHQELKARENISRVLVICPAGLRVKWRTELLTRFDEDFQIMNRAAIFDDLRLYTELEGRQPLQGIVGLETIRAADLQEALDTAHVRYDLVIIDEAHHLRTAGRLSNAVGERMSEFTDHLALLTATPLQTSQVDLYNLLRLIDDSMFDGFDDFLDQLAPNRHLNAAARALRRRPPDPLTAIGELQAISGLRAAGQVEAHPNYAYVLGRLEHGLGSRDDRIGLQRAIDAMNVLAPIYTRTRKRDVANVAKREAHVIPVAITEAELAFYNAVLEHARAQARAASRTGWIPGFVGMMRERQAASSMAATREYLLAAQLNPAVPLGQESEDPDVAAEGTAVRGGFGSSSAVAQLVEAAAALPERDSKLEVFLGALRGVLEDSPDSKVIVFSYFRRTLAYLRTQLREAGIATYLINGDVPPLSRAAIIDRFREESAVRVLLSSEVGAEGLDFQFADTLFNYDLPWNPMRVEQRIGRIDRYGQEREKIRIFSFFLQNTIEERILERLYTRIGIFEDSVGDLEPVLGPLTHELTKEVFTGSLSPDDEIELGERAADRFAFLRREQEELEERQSELLGQDALLLQAIDQTVNSGRYVSSSELRAITKRYVESVGAIATITGDLSDPTIMLVTDSRLGAAVEDYAHRSRDRRSLTARFLGNAARGARIPATFDGETASRVRRLEFLNLRHPLVQAAIAHFGSRRRSGVPIVDLAVAFPAQTAPDAPVRFALFRVVTSGAQSAATLRSIVIDEGSQRAEAIEANLLRLLFEGQDAPGLDPWTPDARDELLLRSIDYISVEADRLEEEARERNDATIAVRQASIERTFRARIAKREAQLAAAVDDGIRRMRSGEVRNLKEELARRLADLESRREVAVSFSPIAIGRLIDESLGAGQPENTAPQSLEPDLLPGLPIEPYPEPPTRWRPSAEDPG